MTTSGNEQYCFRSELDARAVHPFVRASLPDFDWKIHDSEYRGFYLRGKNVDGVELVIVFDDEPSYMYANFPEAWAHDSAARARIDGYCQLALAAAKAREIVKTKILPES